MPAWVIRRTGVRWRPAQPERWPERRGSVLRRTGPGGPPPTAPTVADVHPAAARPGRRPARPVRVSRHVAKGHRAPSPRCPGPGHVLGRQRNEGAAAPTPSRARRGDRRGGHGRVTGPVIGPVIGAASSTHGPPAAAASSEVPTKLRWISTVPAPMQRPRMSGRRARRGTPGCSRSRRAAGWPRRTPSWPPGCRRSWPWPTRARGVPPDRPGPGPGRAANGPLELTAMSRSSTCRPWRSGQLFVPRPGRSCSRWRTRGRPGPRPRHMAAFPHRSFG